MKWLITPLESGIGLDAPTWASSPSSVGALSTLQEFSYASGRDLEGTERHCTWLQHAMACICAPAVMLPASASEHVCMRAGILYAKHKSEKLMERLKVLAASLIYTAPCTAPVNVTACAQASCTPSTRPRS